MDNKQRMDEIRGEMVRTVDKLTSAFKAGQQAMLDETAAKFRDLGIASDADLERVGRGWSSQQRQSVEQAWRKFEEARAALQYANARPSPIAAPARPRRPRMGV